MPEVQSKREFAVLSTFHARFSSTPADTLSQGQERGKGEAVSETGNSHTEERSNTERRDTGTGSGAEI